MPELMVSVDAALANAGGIAVGNVLGSNLANILLILGLSALVAPLAGTFRELRADLLWMVAAAVLCVPLFLGGVLGRPEGAVLLAGLVAFLVHAVRRGAVDGGGDLPSLGPIRATFAVLAGLVALVLGAGWLVDGAVELARGLGVSEAVIGLTIVAVGTSLPELATSVIAAMRGQRDIALGNVIGSNIFNILGILGATAVIAPITLAPAFLSRDLPLVIAVSLLLAFVIFVRGGIGRRSGAVFLALFALYWATLGIAP
jgi:cation:H+ antiporter